MSSRDFKRYYQQTESTCGPTVIRMLLDFYGVSATEEEVTAATQVKESLDSNGTNLSELSAAVHTLAPHLTVWYKEDADVSDIDTLIHTHQIPVGIDWQGLFWETLLEEARLSTNLFHGHYGVVSDIDMKKDLITIADPYRTFKADRIFPIDWFKTRWWDVSDTYGTDIAEDITYYTSRQIFIVVPKNKKFPQSLGMSKVPADYFYQKVNKARISLASHPKFEPSEVKVTILDWFTSFSRKILSLVK